MAEPRHPSPAAAAREALRAAYRVTLGSIPGLLREATGLLATDVLGRKNQKVGMPPGSLVYTGEREVETVRISVIDYDGENLREETVDSADKLAPLREEPTVTWINVEGLHDVKVIEAVGKCFGLHSLVLEDVLSIDQRPKLEDYDDYLYLVVKMLNYDEEKRALESEQVSLVLGRGFVISFQEKPGDVLEPVRERIRGRKGRIRARGADYLAYSLVDCIVDNYFLLLEKFGETFEKMEADLMNKPTTRLLRHLHLVKREMVFLRRSVYPMREAVSRFERSESVLIADSTRPFVRDAYDHTIEVIETLETFRDMLGGMFDLYLSSISNRMNTTMQFLTLVATIFIPLTFVAGIYGMNFEHMPELKWRYGYPTVMGLMLVIGAGLAVHFRRKRWW